MDSIVTTFLRQCNAEVVTNSFWEFYAEILGKKSPI